MWISAVAASEIGVKALFALGRAGRLTAGIKEGRVLPRTRIAVGVVCALEGVVSKD